MNNPKCIIMALVIAVSTIFAKDAVLKIKKANTADKIIQNGKINLSIESTQNIKGIQFDILYNPEQLKLNEGGIISKISNVDIYSRVKDEGVAKVLMFSMGGDNILDININNIAEIIEINFEPINMFNGSSQVELVNIILAGNAGNQISSETKTVFDVSYSAPLKTSISKNYPNPFNPSTTIDYQLSISGNVTLIVYDIKGAEVKTLLKEHQEATYHNIIWDGSNNNGQPVSSGRYILKMIAPGYTETITMTLIK